MKVANRIAVGFAVLILMLIGLVFGQLFSIRALLTLNKVNNGENLNAAITALQMVRDRDTLEACFERFLSTPDAATVQELESAEQSFGSGLTRLNPESLSERNRAEIARLEQFWKEYIAAAKAVRQTKPAPALDSLRAEVQQQLERLRAQTFTVYEVALKTIETEAEVVQRRGERIQYILWFFACTSVIVGSLTGLIIYRSVALPLGALAAGTRAMAQGKGFYRLDTSRTDELSQIAKDFNTLSKFLPGPGAPGKSSVDR